MFTFFVSTASVADLSPAPKKRSKLIVIITAAVCIVAAACVVVFVKKSADKQPPVAASTVQSENDFSEEVYSPDESTVPSFSAEHSDGNVTEPLPSQSTFPNESVPANASWTVSSPAKTPTTASVPTAPVTAPLPTAVKETSAAPVQRKANISVQAGGSASPIELTDAAFKEKNGFAVFACGVSNVRVLINSKYVSLSDALNSGTLAPDGLTPLAVQDCVLSDRCIESGAMPSKYLEDGSVIYQADDYALLKIATPGQDHNIYIGTPSLSIGDVTQ